MSKEFNRIWSGWLNFDWKFGTVLLLTVCALRFTVVLKANMTGSYSAIALIMIFSALTPFIFLSKQGRRESGIVRPKSSSWLVYSLLIGIIFASLLFVSGYWLYSTNIENWYVYIGNSYNIPPGIAGNDKLILFSIMAFSGMIFSPVGEELFFRGIVHASFAKSFGDKVASVVRQFGFCGDSPVPLRDHIRLGSMAVFVLSIRVMDARNVRFIALFIQVQTKKRLHSGRHTLSRWIQPGNGLLDLLRITLIPRTYSPYRYEKMDNGPVRAVRSRNQQRPACR